MSYRKKNIILLFGSLLFAVIVYRAALSKTVNLYREGNKLEEQLAQLDKAPEELAALRSHVNRLESCFSDTGNLMISPQQRLLEAISSYCSSNKVVLKDFPQPLVATAQDYMVETNIITLEGSFIKLLKLVYQLEQQYQAGRVSSLHFLSRREPRTKELLLSVKIYIQNIKKGKNEIQDL